MLCRYVEHLVHSAPTVSSSMILHWLAAQSRPRTRVQVQCLNEQTGQYERTNYSGDKFKMKLQDDGNIAIENSGVGSGRDLYLCSTLRSEHSKRSCVHEYHSGSYFNFNQDNGRYIRFHGFGYVFEDTDSVITRIGTCTKF